MTARAVFEAGCHSALAKYKIAVAEGTYRITADNALVDAILRAWDRTQPEAAAAARRDQAHADHLDAALTRVRRETASA